MITSYDTVLNSSFCAYRLPCGYCTIACRPCLKETQINQWDITCATTASSKPDYIQRTTITCSKEDKE